MLQVCNYKIAAQCFTRAGEDDLETFARASELKEAAQNIWNLRTEKSLKMLEEAAVLFESISNRTKAAECYFDAEDYEKAGSIYYAEFDIHRAGQCFTLARCFKKAAEIYANANLFNECLNSCSEGRLFELGLQYIRSWREEFNDSILEGLDLNASEQKFLEKCAFASYKQQDKEAMMTYVKDFSSFKLMQSFLKKLGCFNELLELLVKFGKYVDAAKIARQFGNILQEAHLLETGHHYQEASSLYLASVLAGSLWANDGEGWPLKEFPSKDELLLKAKTSASKYMPHFHTIVCANIQLLSDKTYGFHELQMQFQLSEKNLNLMGELLAARKILDVLLCGSDISVDLEVKGPKNKVPIATLFRYWNFWNDSIVKILSYLNSLKGKGPCEFTEYGKFCLEFLGVRECSEDPDSGYFLLYNNAKWIGSLPRRSGKKDSVNVWQLVNAGKRYWRSEQLSLGRKVLEFLECAQKLGARKSMPESYNSLVLVQIFEVAASLLIHCRFLKETNTAWHSLMSYIDLSAEEYFASVFSLDKKTFLNMYSINQTVASRNILKDAIFRRFASLRVDGNISDIKEPTCVQLLQLVVLLLGTGSNIHEHHKEILRNFEISSPWRPLLDDLAKAAGQVCHFRDALCEIYNLKSEGCFLILPSYFVYLLDRLLLVVSCCTGCLFATRSSLIEWFIHEDWKINPEMFFPGCDETFSLVKPTFDFLAHTVHGILRNRKEMLEWVHKTRSYSTNNFRLLILKLVILLIMICLNTGCYLELLNDVLLRPEIMARLPTEFVEVISERSGSSLHNVIAEALQRIDDTLVVIRNPKIVEKMYIRRAVFLNVFNQSKDIMDTLFGQGYTTV